MVRTSTLPSDTATPSVGLRLARGSTYAFATAVVGRGLSVLQSILVARILGVTSLGVLALVGVVSSIVSLFSSFAMDASAIKMISPVRENSTMLASIASTFLLSSIAFALPFSIGLTLSAPLFATAFGEPQLGPLLAVAGVNLGLASVLRIFPTLLQSLEKIDLLSKANMLISGIALGANVGLALAWGLLGVAIAQVATTACGLAAYQALIRGSNAFSFAISLQMDWRVFKQFVTLSAPQLGIAMIETVGYAVGPGLIAAFRGFTELGFFRVDLSTSMLLLLVPTSVIVPFLPLATTSYEKDRSEFDRVFLRSSKYTVLFVLPLALVMTAFPSEILLILYSGQYAPAAAALPLFAGAALALAYSSVSGWIYLISGSLRRMTLFYSLSFGILTTLNVTLIPTLGFWGAGLAAFLTAVLGIGLSWLMIRPVYSKHRLLSAVAGLLSAGVAVFGLVALLLPLSVRVVAFAAAVAWVGLVSNRTLTPDDRRFFKQIPGRIISGPRGHARHIRVVVFSPRFYPAIGGVEKHVLRVSQEMLRMGHEVLVVTQAHSTDLPSEEVAAGVPVYRIRSRGRIQIFVELISLLPRILRSDVVHCHDFVTFYYWYLPFRFLIPWKKAFVTFHGYEEYPPPHWAVWRRRLVSLLSSGAFCIGTLIERFYGTPCRLVRFGAVDPEKYRDVDVADKEVRAVFLGRLEPDTDIGMFLRAVHVAESRYGLRLPVDVCGEGQQLTEAKNMATQLGVNAVFHGWVEDPSPLLIRGSFMFASGYLSALEGMAAGCITIFAASNTARQEVMRDLPGPEGAVWVCRSPEEIAKVVADALANPKLRTDVGRAARNFVLPKSWRALASELLHAYGA